MSKTNTQLAGAAKAQHSPLPWKHHDATRGSVYASDGFIVADCYGQFREQEERLANADFIAEACNNYDRVKAERDYFKRIAENEARECNELEAERDKLAADCEEWSVTFADKCKTVAKLGIERDELLAALKEAHKGHFRSRKVEAAIAKIEKR